jgi:formylglycine-generating enzyme required for sulfatase activity
MGSPAKDPQTAPDERPAHKVTLSEFWIGKTEITNKQYRSFDSKHPGEAALPAAEVIRTDAKAACEHFGGDLPTEAQWEYAARAGSRTAWSFGDDEKRLVEYAWYDGNSKELHAVGTKKPNAWGLHDMYGNAWEWVADWYGPYPSDAQTEPTGPSAGNYPLYILRGGAFFDPPRNLRSAARATIEPDMINWYIGFRCVRGPRRQP